jgi:hypothetical protein
MTQAADVSQFCVLHDCERTSSVSHGKPLFAAEMMTDRVWVCEPPPQVLSHADHADQGLNKQFTGQGRMLQDCVCVIKAGQAAPPLAGLTLISRNCVWVPPPHAAEQVDHTDHSLT